MLFSGSRDPQHFKIVRCGLELQHYQFRQPRPEMKRLLCVARISWEKGMFFLIEAVHLLRQQGHVIELAFAGDGPDRSALEARVEQLGLREQVQFLGHKTETQVREELARSDAFVLPSFVEGVPVSAMEAMAIGVPVICTNVGGVSELVEDGVTGLLVRPSDPDSIAKAVLRLKHDPHLAQTLAGNGRKKVEDDFDSDKEFANLNAHFQHYGVKP
jgi:glycosyltransferase involved in cell wall biosynthesis